MAELSIVTAGEDRGHQMAERTDLGATDGVDASMQFVQPAGAKSMHDGFIRHAERQQLLARDDTMLPPR